MVFSKSTLVALLQSSVAFAATVNVNVGGNKALIFTPTTVTANPGDTVQFTFIDQNHTATAGNPNAGCKPSGLFNSGFVPVANNTNTSPTFSVPITNTNPITVYCAQAIHCQSGMVMVINPTTSGATSLAAYQQLTAGATTNTPAKAVNGGVLKNAQTTTTGTGATTTKGKGKGAKGTKAAKTGAKKANRRFALNRLNARKASTFATSIVPAASTGSAASGLPPLPSAVGTPATGAATNGTAPCHTGKGGKKAKTGKKGKKAGKGGKGGQATNGTALASVSAPAAASSATLTN